MSTARRPVETGSSSIPSIPRASSVPLASSISRALSPTLFQDDGQVPIVEVCSGGDMLLNVRHIGFDEHEERHRIGSGAPNTSKVYTEGKLLGRFRVSSVALKMASHYMKDYLDTTLQSPTSVSGSTSKTVPAATGLPLLWVHMDGNGNLNFLTQSKCTYHLNFARIFK